MALLPPLTDPPLSGVAPAIVLFATMEQNRVILGSHQPPNDGHCKGFTAIMRNSEQSPSILDSNKLLSGRAIPLPFSIALIFNNGPGSTQFPATAACSFSEHKSPACGNQRNSSP